MNLRGEEQRKWEKRMRNKLSTRSSGNTVRKSSSAQNCASVTWEVLRAQWPMTTDNKARVKLSRAMAIEGSQHHRRHQRDDARTTWFSSPGDGKRSASERGTRACFKYVSRMSRHAEVNLAFEAVDIRSGREGVFLSTSTGPQVVP